MPNKVEELILFLGAKMDPEVEKKIQSSMNPFKYTKWRKEMVWEKIQEIQEDCQEAMNVWGYTKVDNIEELFDQNLKFYKPLSDLSLFEH
jgi:hypothetical protein